jgi:hypothetical protein
MGDHICEMFFENWDCRKFGLGIRVVWGVKCAVCGLVAVCVSEEEAKEWVTAHTRGLQEDAAGQAIISQAGN